MCNLNLLWKTVGIVSLPVRNKYEHLWLFICCKSKVKKKFCFEKIFLFFTKYTLFAEKNVFIWKKIFFCRKKYKWKCKKIYLISEIYFYTENVCVTNKIKIFLKYIFIPQKKTFLIIKSIFIKTSLWNQSFGSSQSVVFLKPALPKNINELLEKKSVRVFILSKVKKRRLET